MRQQRGRVKISARIGTGAHQGHPEGLPSGSKGPSEVGAYKFIAAPGPITASLFPVPPGTDH